MRIFVINPGSTSTKIAVYEEHAMEKGSDSMAMAYVGIEDSDGVLHWGAGTDEDIIKASIKALVTAINTMLV